MQAKPAGKKNKGSTDMKESTLLPEWNKLYSFVVVVVVVVEQNEKSLS